MKLHKIKSGIYHSGLESDVKLKTHQKFMDGRLKIIVATIAFGMGINKSNVRVVIHYGAPRSIEGYYQEIGRAGRDGEKAYCYAFYNFRDFKIQEAFIVNAKDTTNQKNQLKLLERMKRFMTTGQCRRQLLLRYFEEEMENKCDFCDNCCGTHKSVSKPIIICTEQDVQKEAKLLIDLIESIKNRSFGRTLYINVLRGSANKTIPDTIKKNNLFGSGKHRSILWWQELSDHLIKLGYLEEVHLKGGFFSNKVIKVSKQGLIWTNMADLDGIFNDANVVHLKPVKMICTI